LAVGKLGSFFSSEEFVSIYESIIFAFGAFITYKILFQIRKERFTQGFNLSFSLWFFGLVYLSFDKLKVNHLYLSGYSFNMMASAILALIFSFYFVYYFRSSLISYGKKTFEKIYRRAKRTVVKGQG